jgi:D-serine dehydratase
MDQQYLQFAWLDSHRLAATEKGVPPAMDGMTVAQAATQHINVLEGNFTYPVAVLKQVALDANIALMSEFTRSAGVELAPHGKTTMCPQIFERQLAGGAWGMTCANATHLRVYRQHGVRRIIMANQLLDGSAIGFIAEELRSDPTFEYYGIVDSVAGVERYVSACGPGPLLRPIPLLLEVGLENGRTGVRSLGEALAVARAIARHTDKIRLAGFETYEGIFSGDFDAVEHRVETLLARLSVIAGSCMNDGLINAEEVILSAGGSGYFDLVADALRAVKLGRPTRIILRSGCYVSHDHGFYAAALDRLRQRERYKIFDRAEFQPALEVWAVVQSVPERGRALLTLGKRDVSHDLGLPVPIKLKRPGVDQIDIAGQILVAGLNDHHCYVDFDTIELAVGDLVGFGISHPCTTFDRWRYIYLVNDQYEILTPLRTFF